MMKIKIALLSCLSIHFGSAFQAPFPQHGTKTTMRTPRTPTVLYYNDDNHSSNNNNDDDFDLSTLERRIGNLRLQILEEDLQRPPNASLGPKEFVTALLQGIFHNEDPRPDAGFMLLLRCSTEQWASKCLQSIGAPKDYDNLDTAASALGAAIGRPHNQYAILVGEGEEEDDYVLEDVNNSIPQDHTFYIDFPGETLDFLDGTAWVNVEFRDASSDDLLVLMGWQLCQRPDGAWLVDQIDWQDYREKYRPGIGRSEWMGTYEGRRR
ncbi:expressed unknown protein [Seminavis robusta]|uniref:Uncharacterized protein n=1 Tax=Seminavis robusta TaxID=568900 RepID=A0A9N8HC02_9STRA|nr:expressed unknown protein [Seminavis robusta]|eukprot:Sro358_g125880.1 n/a (266) ;mRNA; f:33663-34460